jgi:hypothetical protein
VSGSGRGGASGLGAAGRVASRSPHRTRTGARSPALVRVTVPVEGGGRAEVVTDAHTRGEGAMAAVCAVTVEGDGDGGGASYGAVWGVGEEAAVCVGALQMLVAHVVGEGKALGAGVDAVVRLDGGEGGGGGELVVQDLHWVRALKQWKVAHAQTIKLQVSGRAAWLRGRSPHRIRCVCVQVDGRVGFEAAVSAATGELRAGVAGERDAAAGLRRAIAVLRGEVAGLDSREATAAALAERDATRALAATRLAELAALQRQVADDAPATALGREELWRRAEMAAEETRRRAEAAEIAAAAADAAVADAIARKVATPLTTAAASAYLRGRGFPAGSQPAGITWGIDTVPADRLTASSVNADSRTTHPGCRLMYPDLAVEGKYSFITKSPYVAGEWVCVDLGGERAVAGALVQGYESTGACSEGDPHSWFRHKFQWSADGAVWTDVDGGRVWSRDGLVWRDVSAAVFGAPVVCRYLRIVAVSIGGILRWEVVVLP